MGAVTSVILALCSKGDHIVAQRQLYGGTVAFLNGPCARFGIDVTFVDGSKPGAFAAAVMPGRTMLVIA
jgi:O-acetylhomoserine/O-acetylserine sulfhydrylase-like pyridoxal-dependent enzyme